MFNSFLSTTWLVDSSLKKIVCSICFGICLFDFLNIIPLSLFDKLDPHISGFNLFVLKLPDELKQAKWIKEERERIMAEAQKDADDIVKEAENRIIAMIDEHEITKKAYEKKNEIIADANEMYREITQGTNTYVDGILANIENSMVELGKTVSNVELSIQNALETIQNNRKELK